MLKKFVINKINFYKFQNILAFKILMAIVLIFLIFLNITIPKPFCFHHNNFSYIVKKIESSETKISISKQLPESRVPDCVICSCECCEHSCYHFVIYVKAIFPIKNPNYQQKNAYISKTIVLEKLVLEIFKPPII